MINDTIAIGPMLHERFHESPVIPATSAQRGACFILEDFFNHWLPRHALHSRWCYPDNVTAAGQNFGMNLMLGKSIDEPLSDVERQKVAGIGQMMCDSFGTTACNTQGAGVDQKEAIQNLTTSLRDKVNKAKWLEVEQKQRLLNSVNEFQCELDKEIGDYYRRLGMLKDLGSAVGEFGNQAMPIADLVEKISNSIEKIKNLKLLGKAGSPKQIEDLREQE